MDTVAYYRASHILVKVAGPTLKDTLDAVAKATDYMNQIRSGKKTFEEMARLYGTDGTASTGGDLGWFGPGRMVKEFEDGVKRTPVGQMSIVKTQFGVHVVKNTATPSHKKIYVQILSKKAYVLPISVALSGISALSPMPRFLFHGHSGRRKMKYRSHIPSRKNMCLQCSKTS